MVVAGSLVSRKLPEIEEGRSMDPSTRCCFYALDGVLNVLRIQKSCRGNREPEDSLRSKDDFRMDDTSTSKEYGSNVIVDPWIFKHRLETRSRGGSFASWKNNSLFFNRTSGIYICVVRNGVFRGQKIGLETGK